jgi:hypothetical protein
VNNDAGALLVPVCLIAVGTGWLLTALGIVPAVDWLWTLGLAVVGVLAFLVGGMNKATVVVGPFFLLASGLSILRQIGNLRFDVEMPILVIAAGILLLVALHPAVPAPKSSGAEGTRDKPLR